MKNPLDLDNRDAAARKCLRRGVRLFRKLAELADQGDAVGVSYAQFVCFLHGVERCEDILGRSYGRADTRFVLRIACQVTEAAGGRVPISRDGVTIRVGMDTFIWRKDRPHVRPQASFGGTAYTETEWKVVFPDGYRRLLRPEELKAGPS